MSIWNKEEIKTKGKQLDKNIDVDILIIGAGMTGMMAAYLLRDKDVCVVDAGRIGHGVTLNTTAKINYLQDKIYMKIPLNNRKKYLESQIFSVQKIKNIIYKEKIDCDFKQVPSFIFATRESEITSLKKEVNFLKNNGVDIKKKELPLNIKSYGSYYVDDTYIFNPIKYLQGLYNILSKDINIYENTKIIKIQKIDNHFICSGTNYHIKANKVILACHYPYFIYPFLLPFKSTIEKSYIIVSRVKEDKNFTCISISNPIYSCRYYNDGKEIFQISLAESHTTSFKQNDLMHFNKVKEKFNLRDSDIVATYSNVDVITQDYMPYIGKMKENMYIGLGYNTWGMTNSVLAATIISDMILDKKNKYEKIFDPNRFNISNIIKFPFILISQIKSFFGPKINKNKYWYPEEIHFFHKNGKSLASYTDKNGKTHIIHNKCPHFGCSLIFNEKELTWDCPCHSSRFDIDGKCIKGPSNYDITYKE